MVNTDTELNDINLATEENSIKCSTPVRMITVHLGEGEESVIQRKKMVLIQKHQVLLI